MVLTQEVKDLIIKEFEEFRDSMYAGKTKEERQELGQFFTPPDLSIQMIERFKWDTLEGKKILDPTSGSGNLLAACLIAGADSDKVFGNEYDKKMLDVCRERLHKICKQLRKPDIQDWQVHQGNALIPDCLTEFGETYDKVILPELLNKRKAKTKEFRWIDYPELYVKPTIKSQPKKHISEIF